jgi:hypothetical protein
MQKNLLNANFFQHQKIYIVNIFQHQKIYAIKISTTKNSSLSSPLIQESRSHDQEKLVKESGNGRPRSQSRGNTSGSRTDLSIAEEDSQALGGGENDVGGGSPRPDSGAAASPKVIWVDCCRSWSVLIVFVLVFVVFFCLYK